jgi:hypothetical protein
VASQEENQPAGDGGPSKRELHVWIGSIVGIAGLIVAIVVAVWQIFVSDGQDPKPPPHRVSIVERARPGLERLQLANGNLTDSLTHLNADAKGTLAMSRSDRALAVLGQTKSQIEPLTPKGNEEQQFKQAAEGVFVAEHTYLRAVRAFLRRNPSKSAQESFWRYSEGLRNRLDDLTGWTSIVSSSAIGGANILSQWLRRKTSDSTAISNFPKPQQVQAQNQIPVTPTPPTTTTSQCSDNIDNDHDGAKDLVDSDCANADDDSESGAAPPPECNNGVDDDHDGQTDFPDDPDCTSATGATEASSGAAPGECTDGLDNDMDGTTDGDDPGCAVGDQTKEDAA